MIEPRYEVCDLKTRQVYRFVLHAVYPLPPLLLSTEQEEAYGTTNPPWMYRYLDRLYEKALEDMR